MLGRTLWLRWSWLGLSQQHSRMGGTRGSCPIYKCHLKIPWIVPHLKNPLLYQRRKYPSLSFFPYLGEKGTKDNRVEQAL